MITESERQEIINAAVEKALLTLPEVVGNLMANNAAMAKLNSKFYKDHPEFKDHKDAVVSVIEIVEGRDPTVDYKDILADAVPEIKKRILTIKSLDTQKVSKNLDRNFRNVEFESLSSHGDL